MEISTQAVAPVSMSAAKSIGVSYVDVEVDTKVEVDCFLCVSTE
jgi:hypothetical protein